MTAVSESCDIAIVGGGLVGSLLALALAEQRQALLERGCQPWRVTLLERHAMVAQPLHGDSALAGRSTALSESTRQLLLKLGLWSHIEPHCAPISTIHVSERGSWGVTRLEASESGLAALGYVVENQPLLAELHRALAATAVTVRARHAPALSERADAAGARHTVSECIDSRSAGSRPAGSAAETEH